MASLVKWLMFSGARDAAGAPVASGTISFYIPGSTSTETVVYANPDASTPLTQPIALDASGRATVYVTAPAEVVVKDAAGVQVALATRGESTDAGTVDCTWASAPHSLTYALADIETKLNAAAAVVPAESIHEVTVSTQNPSFEFDPSKTLNYFHGTYAALSATFTITWPAPGPTLVRGTKYRLVLQGNAVGGGATSVTLVVFPSQIATSTPPTSMLTNMTYSAEFLATQFNTLVQVSPWVATAGNGL